MIITIGYAILIFAWFLFGLKLIPFGILVVKYMNQKGNLNPDQMNKINWIFFLALIGYLYTLIKVTSMFMLSIIQ